MVVQWDFMVFNPLVIEHNWLVVEVYPLKNMKVKWDDDIPNIWKNKKCSKPPTSGLVEG